MDSCLIDAPKCSARSIRSAEIPYVYSDPHKTMFIHTLSLHNVVYILCIYVCTDTGGEKRILVISILRVFVLLKICVMSHQGRGVRANEFPNEVRFFAAFRDQSQKRMSESDFSS